MCYECYGIVFLKIRTDHRRLQHTFLTSPALFCIPLNLQFLCSFLFQSSKLQHFQSHHSTPSSDFQIIYRLSENLTWLFIAPVSVNSFVDIPGVSKFSLSEVTSLSRTHQHQHPKYPRAARRASLWRSYPLPAVLVQFEILCMKIKVILKNPAHLCVRNFQGNRLIFCQSDYDFKSRCP